MQQAAIIFPDTPNVSLVAFYGDKLTQFKSLVQYLQNYLSFHSIFNNKFYPYALEQVHCTVIGCEGLLTELGIANKWFYEKRNQIKYLKLADIVSYLKTSKLLPLSITFGGYQPHNNYSFLSRNLHPFERSWQLQTLNNDVLIPILIGWSITGDRINLSLEQLRRELQRFNLLHKYHHTPESIDNDCYLRLGTIKGQLNLAAVIEIETEIRNILSGISPVRVSLNIENLAFVRYQDTSLPPETTQVIPLAEITPQKLLALYPHG